MSENNELYTILKTLETYSQCDITHSFSEHDTDLLKVSYSHESKAFIISQHDSVETYPDLSSALARLESLLDDLKCSAR
ncbi:hypothetical protein B0G93_101415 [Bacillus sp. V-88]|uniref:hypothetical protein n=1 Tax=Rossellomorea vietnamensis TaxID=218284 RepID=UPI000557A005|nr:hypothetical protein [Rossellomorea vietnamensis]OXS64509.1 hypothetical protein B1B00_01940 [Bacillus sp. DSM 27956]PRX79665.1 hypothetical protein B0G93_101415 [Bacillus sp. V-88]SLK01384.1 hypothetical protein SAMN06295884_101415 [Bacillus sp. V-88]